MSSRTLPAVSYTGRASTSGWSRRNVRHCRRATGWDATLRTSDEAQLHADVRLSDGRELVTEEEVEVLHDSSRERVFDRHDSFRGFLRSHCAEEAFEVPARHDIGGRSEDLADGEVAEATGLALDRDPACGRGCRFIRDVVRSNRVLRPV